MKKYADKILQQSKYYDILYYYFKASLILILNISISYKYFGTKQKLFHNF